MASDNDYYRLAFRVFADFGITIAVPAVLAAFAGKWLDERYQTEPRFVIIMLASVFFLTAFVIVKKSRKYGKEYSFLINKKNKTSKTEPPAPQL